jgi:hypothetical protein
MKSPKIIRLDIDEFDLDSGVDAIALVMQPAIELPFMYFKQQFESYSDYPKQAQENAKRAVKWAEENGWGSCGTAVGKARAHQLANGEPISEETIARMAAFERHRRNSKTPYGEGCGKLMWDSWGGDEGIAWAQRKLKQIRREEQSEEGLSEEELRENKIEAIMDLVEYIDGLPLYTTIEEAEEVAKEIGCEGYHEHIMEDDIILYMPCKEHSEAIDNLLKDVEDIYKSRKKKKNYITNLPSDTQDKILNKLFEVGETQEELEKKGWVIEEMSEVGDEEFAIKSKPNISSLEDYGKFQIRYRYSGPRDSKNRDFCARMLSKNLIFRKEDINQLTVQGENSEFGIYDIFTYKGSYGCRHHWTRLRLSRNEEGKEITQTEESEDAATSINPTPTMNRNPNGEDVAQTPNTVTSTFSEHNKEKQLIAGPLMVPNKLIYRYDDENGEYYVYFSTDTIEKIAYKYLEQGYQKEVNYEHSEEEKLKDITLVESWLVEDSEKDKSYTLTGEKYDKGTWFGIMKVRNKEVWEDYVKSGLVKGFSVEGFFADYMINASKQKFFYRTTEGGTEIVIDEKSFVVFILKDGERQAIMPDGEYKLTNGRTLVVVDSKAKQGTFESTN